MKLELDSNQRYLMSEALRNEWNRLNAYLEELSIDDYNRNGHNIENDIRDIEDVMVMLNVRF